jgi:hypothetical protein
MIGARARQSRSQRPALPVQLLAECAHGNEMHELHERLCRMSRLELLTYDGKARSGARLSNCLIGLLRQRAVAR